MSESENFNNPIDEFALFHEYLEDIKHKNRFIVKKEITDKFDKIIKHCTSTVKEGGILYRGRSISEPNNGNKYKPYSIFEYGIPPKNIMSNGRANPYGINYLYLAADIETVIAELRENIDSVISVGTFEVVSDITVIQLSNAALYNNSKFNYALFEVLLSGLLSTPVKSTKSNIDYLPMQYFSEYCKNHTGIDGLKFLSSVMNNYKMKHYNVTLFNENKVKCIDSNIYKVKSINYTFKQIKEEVSQKVARNK